MWDSRGAGKWFPTGPFPRDLVHKNYVNRDQCEVLVPIWKIFPLVSCVVTARWGCIVGEVRHLAIVCWPIVSKKKARKTGADVVPGPDANG